MWIFAYRILIDDCSGNGIRPACQSNDNSLCFAALNWLFDALNFCTESFTFFDPWISFGLLFCVSCFQFLTSYPSFVSAYYIAFTLSFCLSIHPIPISVTHIYWTLYIYNHSIFMCEPLFKSVRRQPPVFQYF